MSNSENKLKAHHITSAIAKAGFMSKFNCEF